VLKNDCFSIEAYECGKCYYKFKIVR